MLVTASCWRNVLGRNIAHGNGGPGLQCLGSRGSAWIWNVVYRNQGAGIAIGEPTGHASRNTSVVGNVFQANAGGGICLFGAANVGIHQNIATANAHCQLFVADWAVETGLHSINRNCLHAPEGPAIAWGGLPDGWQPPAATVEATGLPGLTGVASDNIGADPGHRNQQFAGPDAEVDPRHPEIGHSRERGLRVRQDVLPVVARRERTDPRVEQLHRAGAGQHLLQMVAIVELPHHQEFDEHPRNEAREQAGRDCKQE